MVQSANTPTVRVPYFLVHVINMIIIRYAFILTLKIWFSATFQNTQQSLVKELVQFLNFFSANLALYDSRIRFFCSFEIF